tara:strand:- start:240 stop:533 length:294 start_codon:yes stop_codon:yes gene_type:complete
VADIRGRMDIKTKTFKPKNISNAFKLITAQMQKLEHGLTLVDTKENFDIIIVKKGAVYHCGLCFGNDVMHCSRPLKQVVKESFIDFIKPYESFTLWR